SDLVDGEAFLQVNRPAQRRRTVLRIPVEDLVGDRYEPVGRVEGLPCEGKRLLELYAVTWYFRRLRRSCQLRSRQSRGHVLGPVVQDVEPVSRKLWVSRRASHAANLR